MKALTPYATSRRCLARASLLSSQGAGICGIPWQHTSITTPLRIGEPLAHTSCSLQAIFKEGYATFCRKALRRRSPHSYQACAPAFFFYPFFPLSSAAHHDPRRPDQANQCQPYRSETRLAPRLTFPYPVVSCPRRHTKSDHTTLAHWQRVQVRSTGV